MALYRIACHRMNGYRTNAYRMNGYRLNQDRTALCRYVWVIISLAMTACGQTPDRSAPINLPLEPTTALFEPNLKEEAEPQRFPSLNSLLQYRQSACRLTERQRKALLETHQLVETSDSTMAILMLASCSPDQTPGLLANSLIEARRIESGPEGFTELVSLMSAQLRSYSLVERQLREAESRLDRLVTGIREIEAEMSGKGGGLYD